MAEFRRSYNPNRSPDWNYGGPKWRLSRSKIDLFFECPRCFFLDNKLGTGRPRGPAFTLNVAVDELFKREFDIHRKQKTRHPIMEKYDVDAVPLAHDQLNVWRENFEGVECAHKETGLTVCGAVDDVWVKPDGALIVVDYKATSKDGVIESLADSAWEEQYKRQIGVYQWLFRQNGFTVDDTGYFVYANATKDKELFDDQLTFVTTLVPCTGTTDWVEDALAKIHDILESNEIPPIGERCEYCPYREAAGKKLQKLHAQNKS